MSRLSNAISQIRTRLAGMGVRARLLAGALGVLTVAGGLWLTLAGGQPTMAPVLDQPLAVEQLASAQSLLQERGIPCRVVRERLFVPRDAVSQVRSILAFEGILTRSPAATFEQLAQDDDIWRTQAQNERRWQAAKMATLSRLITSFPTVRSATVLIEPGSGRQLGRPSAPPTAAVHVCFKADYRMTPRLAQAITDLLCGSVSGLEASAVRIVDNHGVSCRVQSDGTVSGCELAAAAPETVATDAAAPAESSRAPLPPQVRSSLPPRLLAGGLAMAGLVCGYIAWLRRRRVQPGEQMIPDEPELTGRFAFLRSVSVEQVADLLRDEHPQTLALVLTCLPPVQAAGVLKVLGPAHQARVASRVVRLDETDEQTLDEIEVALHRRLARPDPGAREGEDMGMLTIARLLDHAGRGGLAAPARDDQRDLRFEDIVTVPADRLREALGRLEVEELAVALRTAGKALTHKLLACLGASRAAQVRREMERIAPVRLSDVEMAQQHVVEAVRRLAAERSGRSSDEIVA